MKEFWTVIKYSNIVHHHDDDDDGEEEEEEEEEESSNEPQWPNVGWLSKTGSDTPRTVRVGQLLWWGAMDFNVEINWNLGTTQLQRLMMISNLSSTFFWRNPSTQVSVDFNNFLKGGLRRGKRRRRRRRPPPLHFNFVFM